MRFSLVCPFFFLLCRSPDHASNLGYEWEKLPPGSLVIDVGGGVGSQSLTLARRHPNLCFVVQDREAVIADANEVRCTSVPLPCRLLPDTVFPPVLEEKHARRTRLWTREAARSVAFHPCIPQRRELIFGVLQPTISSTRSHRERETSQSFFYVGFSTTGRTNTASQF